VARQQYSPTKGEVLDPTEARQASPRKTNFRVLLISTALIIAIFAGFVIAFLYQTPPELSSSPGSGSDGQPASTTIPQTGEQPAPQNPGSGSTTP